MSLAALQRPPDPLPPPLLPRRRRTAAALTCVLRCSYNTEGDLLVTCGKDSNINLWWTDNGVRAGSFDGHNGVVWTVDMTCELGRGSSGSAGRHFCSRPAVWGVISW